MALPLPYDIRLYLQFDIDDYIGYQTDNEMTATATQKDVSIIYYDYIRYANFKTFITKQICESLKNTNGTECNMVAIGTTSKRLLLITMNHYVYDVPINSLDGPMINYTFQPNKYPLPHNNKNY